MIVIALVAFSPMIVTVEITPMVIITLKTVCYCLPYEHDKLITLPYAIVMVNGSQVH
jgi:hypothetical protein